MREMPTLFDVLAASPWWQYALLFLGVALGSFMYGFLLGVIEWIRGRGEVADA